MKRPATAIPAARELWRRIAEGGGRYALYQVATHFLTGVSGVLAVRWLDPVQMGWWNTSQMVRVPLDATRVGVISGMNREYPYLIGSQQPDKAQEVLELGLAHTLGTLVVVQLALAIWLQLTPPLEPMLLLGLLAASSVWSVSFYAQFVRGMLRTPKFFELTGRIEVIVAAIDALAVLLVLWYGYHGLLARAVGTALLTTILLRSIQPVKVRPRWHWDAFRRVLRFGGRTYLANFALLLGQQAERVILLAAVDGVRLLGLYTPALIGASILQVVPGALHSYFYPQALEAYGRNRDRRALADLLLVQIKRAMALMTVVSMLGAGGVALLIEWFVPNYVEGRTAALIVCLAGPLYPLRMWLSYHHALHRWTEYYVYTGLQALLPFVAMWLLAQWLPVMVAVALGYVVAVAVAGLVLGWQTLRHSRGAGNGEDDADQPASMKVM